MYSSFFSISFIIIFINFFVNISVSFSANDTQFSNCSQPFNCGNIKEVFYPFWGHGRAEYCGLPGYELKCQDDSTEIQIESKSYRVLDINKDEHRLRIATTDRWSHNCPSQFHNISLPPSRLFTSFPNSNRDLILFYGCPLNAAGPTKFSCSVNDTDNNYFWPDDMGSPPRPLSGCNVSIIVHALETLVRSFTSSRSTVEDVLKGGFDAGYVTNVTFCKACEGSGGQCGYNSNPTTPTCFCYHAPYSERCPTRRRPVGGSPKKKKIEIGLTTGIAVVLLMILLFLCWKTGNSSANFIVFWKRKKKVQKLVENFLKSYGSSAPKRYNYSDIKKITGSFKDKIGQGGFGGVYKGKLVDGRLVAVKLLNKAIGDGQEFINEVATISRTSHVNIVSLVGFCFDGSKRALIYEFMANGSLEKFIYDRNPLEAQSQLGWEKLYQIAIGVARGLEYLHRGCSTRILHFDIKPHNILLDQDFTPKISDFGLAKLCLRNESIISMLDARGTAGYIAPEVFNRNFGGVSHKSDVYSYGMMVLEMVGRSKNIDDGVDHTSDSYFTNWIYKRLELDEDPGLHAAASNKEGEITRKMILVALWCIQTSPMDRPSMSKVVEMLEGKDESLSIPPQPYLYSPGRDPVLSSNTMGCTSDSFAGAPLKWTPRTNILCTSTFCTSNVPKGVAQG